MIRLPGRLETRSRT